MERDDKIKVALLEIGHWHANGYLSGVLSCPNARLVAVSERNREVLRNKVKNLDCRKYSDYRELLDKERPDFVFAFGIHSEMPSIANELINREIPFSLEKPCGTSLDDIRELMEKVIDGGFFFSVPFIYRLSPWVCKLKEMMAKDRESKYFNLFLRYDAGFPIRYVEWGCEWMLNKKEAGGGALMNLGVHLLDLVRYLSGDLKFKDAILSNSMHGLEELEDFAHVMLKGGKDSIAAIEVTYRLSRSNKAKVHAHVITSLGSLTLDHETVMRLVNHEGYETTFEIGPPKGYEEYAQDTLKRFKKGEFPIASADDLLSVWQVLDEIYAHAHWI